MCGIVAVVRRPSDRRAPELRDLLRRARRCRHASRAAHRAAVGRWAQRGLARDRRRRARRCAARAARSRCSPIRSGSPRSSTAPRHSTANVAELDAQLDTDAAAGDEIEALNAAVDRRQGRAVGARPRPLAYRARGRTTRRGRRHREPRAIEAFHSIQVALSALDRSRSAAATPPAPRARHRARPRSRRPDDRAPDRGAQRRPAVHVRRGARRRTGISRSSTRPRPRSASSATTRRACAPQIAQRRAAPPRGAGRHRRGRRARAHALGERRHHLRGERAPAEPGGARRATGACLRRRRAQRRRRQLRRPQGARSAALPGRDHDRRQGDPRARVAPDRRRAPTPIEAFRSTVAAFEGSVAIAAQTAGDPGQLLLAQRGSGQALYVGSPRTRTSSRASRTASSRSATGTCGSTARRCSSRASPARRGRSWR